MKKIISILLAAMLIVSICTASVGTAYAADISSTSVQNARDVLREFIAESEAALSNSAADLPEKERTALEKELIKAKAVYAEDNATEQELMDAAQALLAVAESPIVRSAALQIRRVYANMLELVSFVFSAEQIDIVNSAIALLDEACAQDTLTFQGFTELEDKIEGLFRGVESPPITKDNLGTLIEKTTPYKEHPERYTEESYAPFLNAYQEAADTYALASPTADDLELAFSDLALYTASLVEIPGVQKFGDVNGDGEITVADALLLQKALAKAVALDANQEKYGDVDADGKIAVNDVLLIQQYIAMVIDRFPADKPADIEDTPVDDVPFAG